MFIQRLLLFQYVYRKTKQLTGNKGKKIQDLAM